MCVKPRLDLISKGACMDFDGFERTIFQNWAGYYHCLPESCALPGTQWSPNDRWDGNGLVRFRTVGRRSFLQFDPQLAGYLTQALAGKPAGAVLRPADLRPLSGWKAGGQNSTLYHYLYTPDLPARKLAAPVEVRQLTTADAALWKACTVPTRPRRWRRVA